jgi:hypothetical protein
MEGLLVMARAWRDTAALDRVAAELAATVDAAVPAPAMADGG